MANQMLVKSVGVRKRKLTGCCAVSESISSLCLNPELSDVCFLVGDEREKIYAHRVFLAAESEVFKPMFYGDLKETSYEIKIPDLSPVGFRNMIKYFYTKKVEEIDLSEIYPTYMAANKYLASGLIKDLTDHITVNCVNASNVCVIFDQLVKLNIDDSLIDDVKRRIAAEFSVACASDSFKQIDKDTLISILKFNWLNIAELDLIKACLQWTDSEVARKGVDANQANKRTAFEPIKHLIRFGDLSLSDFGSIPQIEDFLTMEEIASVFLHLNHQNKPIQIDYRSPRGPRPKAGVARTRDEDQYSESSLKNLTLSISADRRVCIRSIKTSSVINSTGLKVEVYKDNEWTSLDCKIVACQGDYADYKIYTIEFIYVLEPNTKNELRFSFSGLADSYVYVLNTTEMSLRSDDNEVVFEIENDSNEHCIDSIEFYRPLDGMVGFPEKPNYRKPKSRKPKSRKTR